MLHSSSERDLRTLPKAHLHLHFTGSMRSGTLLELADKYGVHLPEALSGGEPPQLRATDERGWFRFQRLYDIARSCLREPEDIQRLVREAAEEDVRDGSRWLEIQVDPTSYAPRLGGLSPALEIILDAVETASRETGLGMRVLVAANRMKHPLDARTLARLAVRFKDKGIIGFGLSNDERRGFARDFDRAFAIAREGGLLAAPHGGELSGPRSVRDCLEDLRATRVGHGVRAAEDPWLLERLAERGVTCEVCPASNVALGVYEKAEDVPLRALWNSRRADGAGRRRPAAVRLAAGGPVRDRAGGARVLGRGTGRAGTPVGARRLDARGRADRRAGGHRRLGGGRSGLVPPGSARLRGHQGVHEGAYEARGELGERLFRALAPGEVVEERALRARAQEQGRRRVDVGVGPHGAALALAAQVVGQGGQGCAGSLAEGAYALEVAALESRFGVERGGDREALLVEEGGVLGDLDEVALHATLPRVLAQLAQQGLSRGSRSCRTWTKISSLPLKCL